MTTQRAAKDRTSNRTGFDLLVIPNKSLIIAGAHMSPDDIAQARSDWDAYGNVKAVDPSPRWTIALCNPKDGQGRIHAVMQIPTHAVA
jgi:hypothetical protein